MITTSIHPPKSFANVASMHYDARGNRNGIMDPDAGTHTSQYNGHGELMREIIAGDVRTYERDVLGRVKTLQSVDGVSQWVYDVQKAGTLSHSISPWGVKTAYHYDNLTRPDETTWTVNGEVFKVSTTYDTLDRPDTVAYPEVVGLGRTTIQQKYNAFGEVERIDDISPGQQAKTLWAVKDRNRDGALTTSVTGDGLTISAL